MDREHARLSRILTMLIEELKNTPAASYGESYDAIDTIAGMKHLLLDALKNVRDRL